MTWSWHFSRSEDIPGISFPEIAKNILDVFYDGMGRGEWDWSIDNIQKQFRSSNILGLLENEKGEIAGYFFATLPEQKLFGKNLLWIDACSVRKAFQRTGYSQKAIDVVKDNFKAFDFGFIGCRSQNPVVFGIFDKISPGDTYYPFDKLYSKEIMDYLKTNIVNEVKKASEDNALNESNGIIRRAYWGSRLGDYAIDATSQRMQFFEDKLDRWQFDRDEGDAVVILKKL